MEITAIGIDLAKTVFQIHAVDHRGKCLKKGTMTKIKLINYLSSLKKAVIFMEACGSAHYWARKVKALGHEVKLIPGQYVKPFVKRNKNDATDAAALVVAGLQADMNFVAIKDSEHLELQAQIRVRDRIVKERTALINEMRAFLYEHGHTIPKGATVARKEIAKLLADGSLSPKLGRLLQELYSELLGKDQRIKTYEKEIAESIKGNDISRRLQSVPGIGPLTTASLLAAVPDPRHFRNGRHFSAWLGLTPRHSGSGGRTQILSMSRQGNVHLRTLLIHGARSVLRFSGKHETAYLRRVDLLKGRVGYNKATVALANKMGRIAWSIMTTGHVFNDNHKVA